MKNPIKPTLFLLLLGALTVIAMFSAVALNRRHSSTSAIPPGAKTFQVHGEIRSLDPDSKTVRIAHDEIPDYMPAMTMPFTVREATMLKDLAEGDSVQFQLVVTDKDSWISRIDKVASDVPVPAKRAAQTAQRDEAELARVQTGEIMPDFSLLNQDGRTIRLSDFRGKAVVLTFVYTRCPLPNYCPLMSSNFAELQKRFTKEFAGKYQLLSVSIDPEYDRPAILKEYGTRYGADHRQWTFATGTQEEIRYVAGLAGLFYEPENGLISHDLRTVLIAPDGRVVHVWKSNVWTPYEVQRMVGELLMGTKDYAVRH